jgi:hypothetical protein
MKLNFTNPLYVSSYGSKDSLTVLILGNGMFLAKVDNFKLAVNYTISKVSVPPQVASEEDFKTI